MANTLLPQMGGGGKLENTTTVLHHKDHGYAFPVINVAKDAYKFVVIGAIAEPKVGIDFNITGGTELINEYVSGGYSYRTRCQIFVPTSDMTIKNQDGYCDFTIIGIN